MMARGIARRAFGRAVIGALAVAATFSLSGCGKSEDNSYHFKLTVEVVTPQGMKTGSGVYAVRARKLKAGSAEEAERSLSTRGEAVVIDVPEGPVFVLMKTPDEAQDVAFGKMAMAALDPAFKNDWVESAGRISGSWGTLKGEVPQGKWPLMVRFGDLNDPKTVEAVDPVTLGVKRIWVETTSEDVTVGIGKRLGWLGKIGGGFTDRLSAPDPTNPPLSAMTTATDFSTEIDHGE